MIVSGIWDNNSEIIWFYSVVMISLHFERNLSIPFAQSRSET
jgi:hypothetical protein